MNTTANAPASAFDFVAASIDGQPAHLSSQRGRVLLIVNTASACGFTPQFAGLQKLHDRYAAQGLTVIGFPCNQFGAQDSGSNSEIGAFCQKNYGVSFPMMAKVEVNGEAAHPVWKWLKAHAPGPKGGEPIGWNFSKFLVGRDGAVRGRYASGQGPEALAADIEAALAA